MEDRDRPGPTGSHSNLIVGAHNGLSIHSVGPMPNDTLRGPPGPADLTSCRSRIPASIKRSLDLLAESLQERQETYGM